MDELSFCCATAAARPVTRPSQMHCQAVRRGYMVLLKRLVWYCESVVWVWSKSRSDGRYASAPRLEDASLPSSQEL